MNSLVLGTWNRGKARELLGLLEPLGLALSTLADVREPLEVVEDAATLAENAELKAVLQARHLGRCVLADDTGLEVDALGGAAGVFTARFAGPGATPELNRAKLLADLSGIAVEQRTARFVCYLVLADPSGAVRARAVGQCRGRITTEPRGALGFGYDALFEVPEYRRTFAELGAAAKSVLSHRARATEPMIAAIRQLIETRQWTAAVESEAHDVESL